VKSAPVSRQAFLKGVAGVALAAGNRGRWTRSSPPRPVRPGSASIDSVSVTVGLNEPAGRTIPASLYGYATGALLDDGCQLAANAKVQKSAQTLAPSLLRFNTPAAGIMQTVFAPGVSQPNWAPFARWVRDHADFLASGGRLVFGIGPAGGDTSIDAATWASYAAATARYFRGTGEEITWWEVGNECDQGMALADYTGYFNAIADALHGVDPGYRVGGPVSSWYGGFDLADFVAGCGTRLDFIDFHSYPVGDGDSTQTAYHKAAAFADVAKARAAVQGTAAADLPIGLLEYNMNGDEQPGGLWGLPAQGTIAGAVYVALLLTRAATSDPRAKVTMGGLWDLVADSNFGAIGNAQDQGGYSAIDQQGRYLSRAARTLPGQQVTAATSAASLQVLATTSGQDFAVQLVNYSLQQRTAAIGVTGGTPASPLTRWELSARYPGGHATTTASLASVALPPQSVVMLDGQFSS